MEALDLDAITRRNAAAVIDLVTLTFRAPDTQPDEAAAESFMKKLIESLGDSGSLITEIKKLRDQRQQVRDIHNPANSHDPAAPSAICTGCSLHGSRVEWPCPTWKATEDGSPR